MLEIWISKKINFCPKSFLVLLIYIWPVYKKENKYDKPMELKWGWSAFPPVTLLEQKRLSTCWLHYTDVCQCCILYGRWHYSGWVFWGTLGAYYLEKPLEKTFSLSTGRLRVGLYFIYRNDTSCKEPSVFSRSCSRTWQWYCIWSQWHSRSCRCISESSWPSE